MNALAWIFGVTVAIGFGGAGVMKIVGVDPNRDRFRLGYRKIEWRGIGAAEVVGAIGIIVGLVSRKIEWLAISAGVGLMLLMLGALMAHARVEDESKAAVPAAIMLVLTLLFTIFVAVR